MDKNNIVLAWKRRLTHISGSIYVSLPSDWIMTNNLKARQPVAVLLDDQGRLIIATIKETK